MRSVKSTCLLMITVLLMLLPCSCAEKTGDPHMTVSPADKSLPELSTTVYTDEQLSEIAAFDGTMEALDKQYPIPCLRNIQDLYRVSYPGEDKVVVLWFDYHDKKQEASIYQTGSVRADFAALSPGQTLEEVQALDPDGKYLFLYTGRNEPRVSSHCTKDGYLITVEYDTENTVIRISQELL